MSGRNITVLAAAVATVLSCATVAATDAAAKAAPPPKAVTAAKVTAVSSTIAYIAWTYPTGSTATSVIVRYAAGTKAPASATSGTSGGSVPTSRRSVAIPRLAAGTRYTVALFSARGTLRSGGVAVAVTTAPGPVTKLAATPTLTTIKLNWTNPTQSTFAGLTVRYAKGSTAPATPTAGTAIPTTGKATSATVARLSSGTTYAFTVWAKDAANRLSAAAKIVKATLVDPKPSISGVVRDKAGKPVEDAEVILLDEDNDFERNDYTDVNGKYSFTHQPVGSHYLCVGGESAVGAPADGYIPQCFDGESTIDWNGYNDDRPAGAAKIVLSATSVVTADLTLPDGTSVSGTVTVPNGTGTKPLEDADITLFDAKGHLAGRDSTDDAGKYKVTGLIPAAYTACFNGENLDTASSSYVPQCYSNKPWRTYSDDKPDAQATTFSTAEKSATGIDAKLVTGGSIAGSVTSDGKKALDSTVEIFDAAGNDVRRAFTGPGKDFTVAGLPAGSYRVCASTTVKDDQIGKCWTNRYWSGQPDLLPDDATAVTVTAGKTVSGIDLAIAAPGVISGVVTSGVTKQPLEYAQVYVFDGKRAIKQVSTGGDGKYTITGVPPGTSYKVCVDPVYVTEADGSPYGLGATCRGNVPWNGLRRGPAGGPPAGALSTTVASNATVTNQNVVVSSGGGISGTVTSGGSAITNAQIVVFDANGDRVTGNGNVNGGSTDFDGGYTFVGLNAGSYSVCIDGAGAAPTDGSSAAGYLSECRSDIAWGGQRPTAESGYAALPAGTTTTSVTVGNTTPDADADLAPGGAVSGTVTSGEAALTSVQVTVFDDAGTAVERVPSGSGGYWAGGLPAGTYRVCFDGRDGFDDANGTEPTNGFQSRCLGDVPWVPGSAVPSGADTVQVTVGSSTGDTDTSLAEGGSITGTVTNTDGDFPFERVVAFDDAGTIVATTSANGDGGTYSLRGLTPGSYKVCFATNESAYQPQCYSNVAWDGGSSPAPGAATVGVEVGLATGDIDAVLKFL